MSVNFHKVSVETFVETHDSTRHAFIIMGIPKYDEGKSELVYKTLINAGFTSSEPSDIYYDGTRNCEIYVYPEGIHFDSVRLSRIAERAAHFLPLSVKLL
jgi:hypothetical protein